METPDFKNKEEQIKFIVENKDVLIAQKKAEFKKADGFLYVHAIDKDGKIKANKANEPIDVTNIDELKVTAIINTTNLMDNHRDVHMPGIWKKSLQENKMIMHLQEHSMRFAGIIAEGNDLKAYTKFYKWSELGFEFEGDTQALVFESTVKKSRNEFMFEQYAKGFVKNHSVGMRYMKLLLAVNDESYGVEFEAWEKYYPKIVNKEEADGRGYFYVVKEAKVIEGSAVPLGSNFATPTLNNNKVDELETQIKELRKIVDKLNESQTEPDNSTQLVDSTQDEIDLLKAINNKLN